MKEIKFRAWDVNRKKMYYDDEGSHEYEHVKGGIAEIVTRVIPHPDFGGIFLNGPGDAAIAIEYDVWECELSESPTRIYGYLMQYTGLKDKNGKEIYEGDVVSLQVSNYDPESAKNPYEVGILSWMDGRYIFLSDDAVYEMTDCLIAGVWDGEILGNEFENPELLKP